MEQAAGKATKRSETRKRQRRFQIRILETEYAELKAFAEREGVTVGSYIRSRTLDKPREEKPTTRAKRRPSIETQGLSRLLSDIGRVGNNMNQIARGINQGNAPLVDEIREALASLREVSQRAIRLMNGNT